MSLISTAQQMANDRTEFELMLEDPEPMHVVPHVGDEVAIQLEEPHDEIEEIVFTLPNVPGADDQSEIEIEECEPEASIPEGSVEIGEHDPWDWKSLGLANFLTWLKERIDNVPRHSGHDTTGLEKAISYFDMINKEISNAMRTDYKNEIDNAKAEEARAEIESGLERLIERLDKVRSAKYKRYQKKDKKKSGEAHPELVKEAQKITGVSGIVVTVPLLISRLARVCINGSVSAGHDIEDIYHDQVKKYSLNDREQAELLQLMEDMGYVVMRDRGWAPDESAKRSDQDNTDWNQNFPS